MNIKLNIGKERERKEQVRHAHTLLYRPTESEFSPAFYPAWYDSDQGLPKVCSSVCSCGPRIESFPVLYRPRLIDGNSFMFGGCGKGRSHEGIARIEDMRSAHNKRNFRAEEETLNITVYPGVPGFESHKTMPTPPQAPRGCMNDHVRLDGPRFLRSPHKSSRYTPNVRRTTQRCQYVREPIKTGAKPLDLLCKLASLGNFSSFCF